MEETEYTHSIAITLLIDYPLIQDAILRWIDCYDDPEDENLFLPESINLYAIDFTDVRVQEALICAANAIDCFSNSQPGQPIDISLGGIAEFVAYNSTYNCGDIERVAEIIVELLLNCILPEQLDKCFHKPILDPDTHMGIKHVNYIYNKGIMFSVVINW